MCVCVTECAASSHTHWHALGLGNYNSSSFPLCAHVENKAKKGTKKQSVCEAAPGPQKNVCTGQGGQGVEGMRAGCARHILALNCFRTLSWLRRRIGGLGRQVPPESRPALLAAEPIAYWHTNAHAHTQRHSHKHTHTYTYADTQTHTHAHIHLALGAKLWPEWANRRAHSSQTLFYYTHTHARKRMHMCVCLSVCMCMLFFCFSLHLTCQTNNNCTQPHKEATQWRC